MVQIEAHQLYRTVPIFTQGFTWLTKSKAETAQSPKFKCLALRRLRHYLFKRQVIDVAHNLRRRRKRNVSGSQKSVEKYSPV